MAIIVIDLGSQGSEKPPTTPDSHSPSFSPSFFDQLWVAYLYEHHLMEDAYSRILYWSRTFIKRFKLLVCYIPTLNFGSIQREKSHLNWLVIKCGAHTVLQQQQQKKLGLIKARLALSISLTVPGYLVTWQWTPFRSAEIGNLFDAAVIKKVQTENEMLTKVKRADRIYPVLLGGPFCSWGDFGYLLPCCS